MTEQNAILVINKKEKNREKYDILDLTKYILSYFIVAVHVGIFPQILYPWLRVAVPIFFMISAYLLFNKINKNPEDESSIIKKFVIRQLKMYIFWFIVLLPVTILVRKDWFSDGIAMGIYTSIKSTLFSSTFIASWYMSATIWAVLILWKLSSKFDFKIITIITVFIYIICCLRSSYYVRISQYYIIENIIKWFEIIFVNPVFSFPVALFWINIGKLFADGKIIYNNQKNYIIIILSAVLLYIECRFAVKYEKGFDFDCCFALAPLVIALFEFILTHNISIKNAYTLRKISVITYPLHASLAKIIMFLLNKVISNNNLVSIISFISTITICHLAYIIFTKLSKYRRLEFLKNAF